MKKKILIISCFFEKTDTSRPYNAYSFFSGYHDLDVELLYNSFSHTKKEYTNYNIVNSYRINGKKYQKNLSLKRIYAYLFFTIKTLYTFFKIIKNDKKRYEYIYIPIPLNLLAAIIIFINKRRKNKSKIIIDVVDLWPEALPVPNKFKKLFNLCIGNLWSNFRKYAIKNADFTIFESEFFYEYDKENVIDQNSKVVHLSKKDKINIDKVDIWDTPSIDNEIHIAYLGNISYIYDFESLINLSKMCQKKVTIHLIGRGNRKGWLINCLENEKINFVDYGAIYEESEKYAILKKCHFGFNGYSELTEVALSYKSIDYLNYALPLINSAKFDTWNLVEEEKIGFNYTGEQLELLVKKLECLTDNSIKVMKQNTKKTFINLFEQQVYIEKMSKILDRIEE